jgi:hypothetical protein
MLCACAVGCGVAHAGEKKKGPVHDYPDAGPSASVSAMPVEEQGKVANGHKDWVPDFSEPFVEENTPAPSRKDWETAPIAKDVRITGGCQVKRLHEWYRVSCGSWAELVSGTRSEVTFDCQKADRELPGCNELYTIFPARRGDRRAITFFGWSKWGPDPGSILTEQFLPGDPRPLISLQGIRFME